MPEQSKKLRLDELKVESFVTAPVLSADATNKIQGGTWAKAACWIVQELIEFSAAHCSNNAPGGCYKSDPAVKAKVGSC
jgi:hypothetical protein